MNHICSFWVAPIQPADRDCAPDLWDCVSWDAINQEEKGHENGKGDEEKENQDMYIRIYARKRKTERDRERQRETERDRKRQQAAVLQILPKPVKAKELPLHGNLTLHIADQSAFSAGVASWKFRARPHNSYLPMNMLSRGLHAHKKTSCTLLAPDIHHHHWGTNLRAYVPWPRHVLNRHIDCFPKILLVFCYLWGLNLFLKACETNAA